MFKRISFYVFVFYCFEVGLFLVVAPWLMPNVWEQNYFFHFVPNLKSIFLNHFFRGAISGLGILNVFLAIWEVIEREKSKHLLKAHEPKIQSERIDV